MLIPNLNTLDFRRYSPKTLLDQPYYSIPYAFAASECGGLCGRQLLLQRVVSQDRLRVFIHQPEGEVSLPEPADPGTASGCGQKPGYLGRLRRPDPDRERVGRGAPVSCRGHQRSAPG